MCLRSIFLVHFVELAYFKVCIQLLALELLGLSAFFNPIIIWMSSFFENILLWKS